MSRLDIITIAIVVVCLAALGYLVYKIAGLYKTEEPTSSVAEGYGNDAAVDEQTYTDWDDEVNAAGDDVDLDDDELGSYADTDETSTTDGTSSYDQSEMDSGTDVAETGASDEAEDETDNSSSASNSGSSSSSTATATQSTPRSTGRYMVIAGSYRQRTNADNQVAKLRKMGYDQARVELFDRGSYAVVLVNRFNAYGDAKRLVSELSGKGIDAMVSE